MTQAMTDGLDPRANVTLSGRELAMQRRQAMARLGKVGAGKTAAAGKTVAVARAAAHVVPAASTARAASQSAVTAVAMTPAPVVKPARARREALSRMGKSALPAAQQQASARRPSASIAAPVASAAISDAVVVTPVAMESAVQAAATPVLATMDNPARPVAAIPSGRALAQARRNVLAKEGKSGLKRVAQAVKIAAALPEQNWQAAISQGATGRQIAMQHRLVRSLTGRAGDAGAATASRPAGRVRPTVAKGEAPVKVEEGHTLSGQRVTGTMIERSKLVTGNEPGAMRAITGTEYISAEQFERSGVARPQGAPAKVSISETAKGKSVTGALVGRSSKVTGDEVGATRALTGTAYLGSAQPAAAPEKVILTHTAQGKPVTGTSVGGGKLTGDERGMCARITGTEYLAAETVRSECQVEPAARPSKVMVSTTLGSQPVSGAGVGRSARVTGDEPGACRPITGSQYYNTNDFAALCASPSPRRAVSVMPRPASAGETAFPKSAGDAGREAACATAHPAAHPFGLDTSAVRPAVAVIPAIAVTGDRPGAGGAVMTGDERGACISVSGTPYLGEDNARVDCPTPASGRFLNRARPAEREDRAPAPLDFSIHSPAREAWERRGAAITGASMAEERITGPIAKAGGLITGTPDFRHRTVAGQQEHQQLSGAARLSGEGAQAGSRVTGDAWHAQSRVTGTEGASVLARNLSQRGEPRGVGVVGAREFRDIERQPVPESRVTGSSGNTVRGALVTVSGGARA